MANSTVCQSKWKPTVEHRRAKPKTYRQAPTHWLKFYEEAVIEADPESSNFSPSQTPRGRKNRQNKQAQIEQTQEKLIKVNFEYLVGVHELDCDNAYILRPFYSQSVHRQMLVLMFL